MKVNILDNLGSSAGCYMIKNTLTGDFYVGKAVRLGDRASHHRRSTKNGYWNSVMQKDAETYGAEAFEFTVLCVCDKKLLELNESLLIESLNPTYNIKQTERKGAYSKPNMDATWLKRWAAAMLKSADNMPEDQAERLRASVRKKVQQYLETGEISKQRAPAPEPMRLKHPDGRELTYSQAAEEIGIGSLALRKRYERGDRGEALFRPPGVVVRPRSKNNIS